MVASWFVLSGVCTVPDLPTLAASLEHLDELLSPDVYAARRRDPEEPGRARKERMERELADLLAGHFRRLGREIKKRLRARAPHIQPYRGPVTQFSVAEDYLLADFGDEFWDGANRPLIADLMLFLLRAARDGIQLFAGASPIGLDYSAANTEAAAWASRHTFDLVKGMTDTLRSALRQAVTTFINTPGVTVGDVAASLPLDEARAQTVAATEITRAYAQGNQAAGEQLAKTFPGVQVVKRWYTNNDDRVCPICAPLNGSSVDIQASFTGGDGEPVDNPPAHPNCRCWTATSTVMPATEGRPNA